MKKKRFYYEISGYRWAPESFHVRKGLVGQPAKNLPLTTDERQEVGYLFLTKGFEAALGYVKHTERAQERQCRSMITYGFRTKETPRTFVYCPQLYCRSDADIKERLYIFKKVRSVLDETGGRVVVSAQCDLDGEYRPTNFKENTVTVDFSRPLRIPMGSRIVRDGPEPPYRPRSKLPPKAPSRKHRKSSPIR